MVNNSQMGVVSGKNLQFPSVVKGQEWYSVKKGAVDPLVPEEHLGVLALTGFVTELDSSISCNLDAMSQAEMRVIMQSCLRSGQQWETAGCEGKNSAPGAP